MTEIPSAPRKSSSRKFIYLAGAVVLVVGGWSAAWVAARSFVNSQIDAALQNAAAMGFEIACSERSLGGYPFRFELTCKDFALRTPVGHFVSVAELRAVALAYNPQHIIIEADSPMAAFAPGDGPIQEGAWESLRASLRFNGTSLRQLDAVIAAPRFFASENPDAGEVSLAGGELHLRPNPAQPDDLDLAVSFKGLKVAAEDQPGDGSFIGQISGGAPLLSGTVPQTLFASTDGHPALTVTSLELTSGGTRLSTTGQIRLETNGTLSGELPLTAVEPDGIKAVLAPFFPSDSGFPEALQGAVISFGKATQVDGKAAVEAKVQLTNGSARIGILPFAQIDPVY
ncbi:DUF2125 domain-containing protein [Pannonibacter sp. Pt2]|uniref:DUF2125 domain-containing protein n=1 Tax=Pannonibacter anstelovis TaxID=3121537 RepID=A0ABU7ZM04_9HYPH